MFLINSVIFCLVVVTIKAESCTTPNGLPGKCKPLNSCPALMEIFANAKPEIVDLLKGYLCNKMKKNVENHIVVCCNSDARNYVSLTDNKRYCGYQHSDDYIYIENNTAIDEYPWLAAVMKIQPSGKEEVLCFGTLINSRYILTSAACAKEALNKVRLGEFNTLTAIDCVDLPNLGIEECSQFEDYEIEEKMPHPYHSAFPDPVNDIGLIRLSKMVTYTDYIRPICLPTPGTKLAKPQDVVYSTGWDEMRVVKTKIVGKKLSNAECVNLASIWFDFNEYHSCKEYSNVNFSSNTCLFITGAPTMRSVRNQWHIEGIAESFVQSGIETCLIMHTTVVPYLDWIKNNMRP